MRLFIFLLALVATASLGGACSSSEQSKSDTGAQPLPTATIKQSSQPTTTTPAGDAPPVSIAHGGAPPSSGSQGMPSGGPDTSALDKKIEQAEAKAKASGATQADKSAAAALYVERANVFYNAGQPTLYKFALRDFRRALRYDPNNTEARAKQDQIVEIYQQMGRPVPELGNEP
jgi:hypothetical protein